MSPGVARPLSTCPFVWYEHVLKRACTTTRAVRAGFNLFEETHMKTWKARIQIGGKGGGVDVQVQAKTQPDAKKLLLGQYPPGTKFLSGPTEVR